MSAAPERHRDLVRALRRLGLSPDRPPAEPADWAALLDAVSRAYHEADTERYTLERSIELSSQEMRALHDALSHRARHDSLTGLPNRAAFLDLLAGTLDARGRRAGRVAVLFIDLDGFKLVNDVLGHAVGDELLIRAAERIRAVVRPDDVVARLGGDEFVVLCRDVSDVAAATGIAGRIGEQVETPFRLSEENSASVSASIGIALATDGTTAEQLIANADIAMYAAKTQGRARFLLFDDAMRAQTDDRLATENALRKAVERKELRLHFQPIVELGRRRMVGAEALLLWDRQDQGLQDAQAFLPLAEQSQLVTAIDAWMLTEACRRAAAWPDQALGLAVNMSVQSVQHPEFVPRLSAALHGSGLHPRRLTLELAETPMMQQGTTVADALTTVADLGVGIALDGFGSGHASLTQLRRLPARALKLDRTITADVDHDDVSAAVVSALIAMAHAIGMRVVAEGVERPRQGVVLGDLGCDAAQGNLFGRPGPELPTELPTEPASRPAGSPTG